MLVPRYCKSLVSSLSAYECKPKKGRGDQPFNEGELNYTSYISRITEQSFLDFISKNCLWPKIYELLYSRTIFPATHVICFLRQCSSPAPWPVFARDTSVSTDLRHLRPQMTTWQCTYKHKQLITMSCDIHSFNTTNRSWIKAVRKIF